MIDVVDVTEDGVVVECNVTNITGSASSKCVVKKVKTQENNQQRPVFVLNQASTVNENRELSLKVGVIASPEPTVVWKHNGNVIQEEGDYHLIFEDGIGILKVFNVQDGSHEFTCTAENKHGKATVTVPVNIGEQKPEHSYEKLEFVKGLNVSYQLSGTDIRNNLLEHNSGR